MLYCSDCDKDVEFKSLDVGGKLTHFCPDCGESNLFKSKDEFQAGVDFVIETTKKFEEEKKKKEEKIKSSIGGLKKFLTSLISGFLVFLLVLVVTEIIKEKSIESQEKEQRAFEEKQGRFNRNREKILSYLKVGELVMGQDIDMVNFKGRVTIIKKDYFELIKSGDPKTKSKKIYYSTIGWIYPEAYVSE